MRTKPCKGVGAVIVPTLFAGLLAACSGTGSGGEAHANLSGPEGWQLVWSDEFEGTAIDRSKWDFDLDCWAGGNDERQCYTDRERNAAIEDGRLVITALREEMTGSAWPFHMRATRRDPSEQKTQPFTSARLVTRGHAAWRYAKIEVRARLPQGQGVWPAIWMMPEDDVYGGWPRSGEIDILETVNLGVECDDCEAGGENSIVGTLHFGDHPPANQMASSIYSYPAVLDGGFHTFGIIWREGSFAWTIDGEVYATKTADDWFTAASDDPNAPFDERFHLILNLAIGGRWPEGANLGGYSEEGFPKRMEVEWVRVWQCADDPETGQGCE